jgi:hypothetical protein
MAIDLFSTAVEDVAARVAGFTLLFIAVRLFCSHIVYGHYPPEKRITQGTKCVIVVHSAFQAAAALWLVFYDPVVPPLLREIASRPTALDLANTQIPSVALLATVAAGEFTCQMLHVYWWYEKSSDLIMVGHHSLSAIFWPIAVAAGRCHYFLATMLFYELSTPFMGLLHFFKEYKVTYAVLGTIFTFNFVVARLFTMPFTLYSFYLTWHTFTAPPPPASPGAAWFGPVLQMSEKITVPLPLLVNLWWGKLVVLGYIKALSGKGGDKKKKKPA